MAKKHLSASERMGYVSKVDNHRVGEKAKIEIRRHVLAAIGDAGAHVLDAYAGTTGVMHREVWKQAASYTGIDLDWPRDDRRMFVGDNRRILRGIDLEPFTVFDLDSHGCPWEPAIVIAHRRAWKKGERVAFVITDASGLKLVFDRLPKATSYLSGLPQRMRGSFYGRELVFDACVDGLMKIIGGRVIDQWRATRHHGAAATYSGLVVDIS